MRKQILTACLAVLAFASCTTDSDKDNDTIAKQILGKWMLTRMDGNIVPTNAKVVYTFESVTSGYISASRADFDGELTRWTDHAPSEVSINGRMVNMSGTLSKSTSFTADIEITDINDRETQSMTDYTVYHNGDTMYTSKGATLWTKVNKDYSTDILGVWEGRVTNTEGSEYDDGELHRWEYLADGSYIYYHLDADSNWYPQASEFCNYFVDGNLLCTRWKNSGYGETEHREWWEIAYIENGVMHWTALRQNDDGSTYTATFQMAKVQ